jgi:hypothetical protein
VRLLLTTANDAGAPGRDEVFGNGILNITRAFQPQGTTTMAGTSTPVSTSTNGTASGPMGDAGKTGAMAGAIILDGYSRAYAIDLAKTLARAPQETPLAQSLQGDFRTAAAAAGKTAISITVSRDPFLQAQRRDGPGGPVVRGCRQSEGRCRHGGQPPHAGDCGGVRLLRKRSGAAAAALRPKARMPFWWRAIP